MKPLPDYYKLPDDFFSELLVARTRLYLDLEPAVQAAYDDGWLLRAFAAHDTALHELMVATDLKRKRSLLMGLLSHRETVLENRS